MKKLLFLLFLLSMSFAHGMEKRKIPKTATFATDKKTPLDSELLYRVKLPKLRRPECILYLFMPSINDVLSLAVRLPLETLSSQDPISSLPILKWISQKDLHIALSEAAFATLVGTTGLRASENEKPNETMCLNFAAGFVRSLITRKLSGYINQQLASLIKKSQENRKIDPAALVAPLNEYLVRSIYDILLIIALQTYQFKRLCG